MPLPSLSLRFSHQPSIITQRLEHRFEELDVAGRRVCSAIELVDLPDRPRHHRWIHRVEVPLERRNGAVGMLRPRQRQEPHLLPWRTPDRWRPSPRPGTPGPTRRTTGTPTCRASARCRRSESGAPNRGSSPASLGRRRRLRRVAFQPVMHVVVVELLRPEQTGERLPLNQPLVCRSDARAWMRVVELVRLPHPPRRTWRRSLANGLAFAAGQKRTCTVNDSPGATTAGELRRHLAPALAVRPTRGGRCTTASLMPSFT